MTIYTVYFTPSGISISTDKADALYKLNSLAKFTIACPGDGKIEYILSCDGKDVIRKDVIQCQSGDVCVEGTLSKPGFLLCSAIFYPSDGNERQTAAIGAGFEPEEIKPAQGGMPSDFDKFWQQKKQQLAVVPMRFTLTPEPNETKMEIYDVNISCLGKPVRGYYAKPLGARKKTCPAIVFFQGAGVRSASKTDIKDT